MIAEYIGNAINVYEIQTADIQILSEMIFSSILCNLYITNITCMIIVKKC